MSALIVTMVGQCVVDTIQTRMERYEFLDYYEFDQELDELFDKDQ